MCAYWLQQFPSNCSSAGNIPWQASQVAVNLCRDKAVWHADRSLGNAVLQGKLEASNRHLGHSSNGIPFEGKIHLL